MMSFFTLKKPNKKKTLDLEKLFLPKVIYQLDICLKKVFIVLVCLTKGFMCFLNFSLKQTFQCVLLNFFINKQKYISQIVQIYSNYVVWLKHNLKCNTFQCFNTYLIYLLFTLYNFGKDVLVPLLKVYYYFFIFILFF